MGNKRYRIELNTFNLEEELKKDNITRIVGHDFYTFEEALAVANEVSTNSIPELVVIPEIKEYNVWELYKVGDRCVGSCGDCFNLFAKPDTFEPENPYYKGEFGDKGKSVFRGTNGIINQIREDLMEIRLTKGYDAMLPAIDNLGSLYGLSDDMVKFLTNQEKEMAIFCAINAEKDKDGKLYMKYPENSVYEGSQGGIVKFSIDDKPISAHGFLTSSKHLDNGLYYNCEFVPDKTQDKEQKENDEIDR